MYYYLIIALQAFCIYHLIKNRISYYWILIIVFLPLIGCIIYILTQVFNKKDVDKLNDGVTSIVNPTKKITDLEKKLDFVETYQNKVDLADAYLDQELYEKAIENYKFALQDSLQNNDYVLEKLVEAHFYNGDYQEILNYIEQIKNNDHFKGSNTQFLYGLTLEKLDRLEEAETNLKPIDQRFSNYKQRLILAQFFIRNGKKDEATEILDEVYSESLHMNKSNKKKYRATIRDVQELREKL